MPKLLTRVLGPHYKTLTHFDEVDGVVIDVVSASPSLMIMDGSAHIALLRRRSLSLLYIN